jgi:hypothetical protein
VINSWSTPTTVHYDLDGGTIFPPACVMPLTRRRRTVVLERVRTGQRPTSVDWMSINSLVWEL